MSTQDHLFVQKPKKEVVEVQDELEHKTKFGKLMKDIRWLNVFILGFAHLSVPYAVYLRYGHYCANTEIFMKFSLISTQLAIIIGNHRLWSHRAFKASKSLQIVLAILSCGIIEQSSYIWARDHRMHHKYSDTHADPHNVNRGFFFSHIGWLLLKKHKEVLIKGKDMDYSDLENNPIIMFQHKYYYAFIMVFFFFLPTFIPWYFWGESLMRAFFICVMYKWMVSIHIVFTVNSFAHRYGWRTYNKKLNPADSVVCFVTTLGEGYHNFHHAFPSDYRSSEYVYDGINVSALIINMLHKLGLVYDIKATPKSVVDIWVEKYGNPDSRFEGIKLFISKLLYVILMVLFFVYI